MEPQDLQIDPGLLDKEWLRQPRLSREAGAAEAEARHEHDQAKARLAVVAARLALAIRSNPTKYGIREKPNADEIDACALIQPEHLKAVEELNQAKYALDVRTADTVAMVDRRKALENLVQLLQLDYFAEKEPRVSGRGQRSPWGEHRGTATEGVTDFNLDQGDFDARR